MNRKLFFIALTVFSCSIYCAPKHLKKSEMGEYLEYDMESRSMILRREFGYHAKTIVSTPFKAIHYATVRLDKAIKHTKNSIKRVFSNSRSVHGQNRRMKKALRNWQGLMYYNDYNRIDERNNDVSLIGIASDSWYLLKHSFYSVGVVLPRESYRTLKTAFYGAFAHFYD